MSCFFNYEKPNSIALYEYMNSQAAILKLFSNADWIQTEVVLIPIRYLPENLFSKYLSVEAWYQRESQLQSCPELWLLSSAFWKGGRTN